MALITRCPNCSTAFRVTPLDLHARGGDVRCGYCGNIFSAYASLSKMREPEAAEATRNVENEGEGPQEPGAQTATEEPALPSVGKGSAGNTPGAFGRFEGATASGHSEQHETHAGHSATGQTAPEENNASFAIPQDPPGHIGVDAGEKRPDTETGDARLISPSAMMKEKPLSEAADGVEGLHGGFGQNEVRTQFRERDTTGTENASEPYTVPQDYGPDSVPSLQSALAWGTASLFLLFALAAQMIYLYRAEISVLVPHAQPYIEQYCKILQCNIPSLPQPVKMLSIESSDMQADPRRQGVNTLTALVRNYASYPQIYPLVQLTLVDARDQPLASRTFPPPAYLEKGADFSEPVAPNGAFNIGLRIDSGTLSPAGYRLLLLYPRS